MMDIIHPLNILEELIERRKGQRYQAVGKILATAATDSESVLCLVFDINQQGMSFFYQSRLGKPLRMQNISLFPHNSIQGINGLDIDIKPVWDCGLTYVNKTKRVSGVQFDALVPQIVSQLKCFIQNHMIG